MLNILEAIALNPSLDGSIINLISGIATHLLNNSSSPDVIKKLGTDLIVQSDQIVKAVLNSTPAAQTGAPRTTTLAMSLPPSPRAG